MTRMLAILSSLVLSVGLSACHGSRSDDPPDASASSPRAAEDPASDGTPTVEHEPAYPAEVSSEELSEGDVAQQGATHSHDGGEEHSHDDEGHDHGEEGTDDDHHH